MIKIKKPFIIKDILSKEDYKVFSEYLLNRPKNPKEYDANFGRYSFADAEINKIAEKVTPIARAYFESENLIPTYSLFAHYEGNAAQLWKHIDDNACTYTLDMCVYQNEPWDIGVRHDNVDTMYTLYPNQALAFYGNDQFHWRNKFPNPESQYVALVFFHFTEPDHWYFTKGPSYLEVIRGIISEEQWLERQR